eukprot:CAMPEP_0184698598 /NCGR_PEP_ID=MMETSP0313-20130426/5167_1 /TAXON_ID=2792 /ORGANISM="Porphyridium aerugineum, Strain SAG 1380-2" /LENGTH=88 /DNA_ID=CAMNT_0027157561 /DNA_START=106 /DNA_END=372 /DNA_ORIENTATION=-
MDHATNPVLAFQLTKMWFQEASLKPCVVSHDQARHDNHRIDLVAINALALEFGIRYSRQRDNMVRQWSAGILKLIAAIHDLVQLAGFG